MLLLVCFKTWSKHIQRRSDEGFKTIIIWETIHVMTAKLPNRRKITAERALSSKAGFKSKGLELYSEKNVINASNDDLINKKCAKTNDHVNCPNSLTGE